MSEAALDYLGAEIKRAIEYVRKEFDMSYAEVIGLLTMWAIDMHNESAEEEEA